MLRGNEFSSLAFYRIRTVMFMRTVDYWLSNYSYNSNSGVSSFFFGLTKHC